MYSVGRRMWMPALARRTGFGDGCRFREAYFLFVGYVFSSYLTTQLIVNFFYLPPSPFLLLSRGVFAVYRDAAVPPDRTLGCTADVVYA